MARQRAIFFVYPVLKGVENTNCKSISGIWKAGY